jgi:hypothetical protein
MISALFCISHLSPEILECLRRSALARRRGVPFHRRRQAALGEAAAACRRLADRLGEVFPAAGLALGAAGDGADGRQHVELEVMACVEQPEDGREDKQARSRIGNQACCLSKLVFEPIKLSPASRSC